MAKPNGWGAPKRPGWFQRGARGLRVSLPHRPVTVTYKCICDEYLNPRCRVHAKDHR